MAVVTTTAGSDTSSLGTLTPVPILREDLLFVGSGVPASGNDTLASTDTVPTVTIGQDVLFVAPETPQYVPATLDGTLSAASMTDLPAPTLAAEGMVLLDESMLLESALLQPSDNYVPSSNDAQSVLSNALTAGSDTSSLGTLTPVPIVREDLLFVGSEVPASGNDTLPSTGTVSTVTVGQDANLSFISGPALVVGQDVLFVAPETPQYVPATLDNTLSAASMPDLPAPIAAERLMLTEEEMLRANAAARGIVLSPSDITRITGRPSPDDPQYALFNAMTAGKTLTRNEAADLNDLLANSLSHTGKALDGIISNMR